MSASDTTRRSVLVTGASRGIGRAIARTLGAQGWSVGVNYNSNAAAAEEIVAEIRARGGQACALQGDVSDNAQRQALVAAHRAAFHRFDALVNNAGVAPEKRADVLDATEASFDRVLNINLKGPYFLTQQVARTMLEQLRAGTIPEGFIVNIGSLSSYAVSTNRGEYCVSKAGLSMMTQVYAARLAGEKIQVHEVCPGVIDTDMAGAAKAKYDKLFAEGLAPIERWGQGDDVARCVAAILSGAFPYSAGQVFHVDGGYHIRRI
jgi:NAD(P)-dependent dehydrogenase (short-subunit alcohol dehydrogenase family)